MKRGLFTPIQENKILRRFYNRQEPIKDIYESFYDKKIGGEFNIRCEVFRVINNKGLFGDYSHKHNSTMIFEGKTVPYYEDEMSYGTLPNYTLSELMEENPLYTPTNVFQLIKW